MDVGHRPWPIDGLEVTRVNYDAQTNRVEDALTRTTIAGLLKTRDWTSSPHWWKIPDNADVINLTTGEIISTADAMAEVA